MLSVSIVRTGLSKRLGVVLATVGLVASLAACGTDSYELGAIPSGGATLSLVPSRLGDPARYDAIVLGSEENNPLSADVYGVTFDPLNVERITVDKRVSSVDANAERIVVAAADSRTDRLAFVALDGELAPVPGIGRLFAYAPVFTSDGGLLYQDFRVKGDQDVNRYWRWDESTRKAVQLFRSTEQLFGPFIGDSSDERLAFVRNPGMLGNEIVLRNSDGTKPRSFAISEVMSGSSWGASLLALSVAAEGSKFGDTPSDLIFLNPKSGEQVRVPGYQAVAWTPDGTKLLVRSTGDLGSSVLSLLDPKNPTAPQSLGTIPGLAIYSGAWVGDVP